MNHSQKKKHVITRLTMPTCPTYSVKSSGFDNGNAYDRTVPLEVPTNNDLPV